MYSPLLGVRPVTPPFTTFFFSKVGFVVLLLFARSSSVRAASVLALAFC